MKRDIRKFLGNKLCEYKDEIQNSHTLHQLLEDICNSHSIISISQIDKVFAVRSEEAHKAYHIIIDTIWHIKLFEEERIIQFYEQAEPPTDFEEIFIQEFAQKSMGDCVIISGDIAKYILQHCNLCFWIHPDIENYVKNDFDKIFYIGSENGIEKNIIKKGGNPYTTDFHPILKSMGKEDRCLREQFVKERKNSAERTN